MKPGPKPKSNLLKLLEGNPGRRPLRNNLRIKLLERRRAPRWLPKYGKQFWRIYTPLLKSYPNFANFKLKLLLYRELISFFVTTDLPLFSSSEAAFPISQAFGISPCARALLSN
jgi:hypothetical protein